MTKKLERLLNLPKLISRLLTPPLTLFSWVFGALTYSRNFLYDRKIKKVHRFKPFVVSVGNLAVGGVGKSPWTMKIAEDLSEKKVEVALLSRGYRSQFEHQKQSTLICDGQGPLYLPHECGDEPYMISTNLPHIPFYVGKSRIHSAKQAEKKNLKVLICDDALQHRKLHRDCDVVVLDARSFSMKTALLPLGKMREPMSSLKRAHLIIVNHVQDPQWISKWTAEIKTKTKAPIIFSRFESKGFYNLKNESVNVQKGEKIAAFCALGNPTAFFESLRKQGFDLVLTQTLRDHQVFETKALEKWLQQSQKKGAHWVLCTEKDAVKLPKLPGIAYQKIQPVILSGESTYQTFLEQWADHSLVH